MSLTERKHLINETTFYFPKDDYPTDGPNVRSCRLTNEEATAIAKMASEVVDLTLRGAQTFSYEGHTVTVYVRPGWVDFGLLRCMTHGGTFTSSLDHVYCRKG
jgi:hypothetical protein